MFLWLGGFNQKQNLVLIFDVARFKYPPYWVELERLYESFKGLDTSTKKPRGFALLTRKLDFFS